MQLANLIQIFSLVFIVSTSLAAESENTQSDVLVPSAASENVVHTNAASTSNASTVGATSSNASTVGATSSNASTANASTPSASTSSAATPSASTSTPATTSSASTPAENDQAVNNQAPRAKAVYVLPQDTLESIVKNLLEASEFGSRNTFSQNLDATSLAFVFNNQKELIKPLVQEIINKEVGKCLDHVNVLAKEVIKAHSRYPGDFNVPSFNQEYVHKMVTPSYAIKEDVVQINVKDLAQATLLGFGTMDVNVTISHPSNQQQNELRQKLGFSFFYNPRYKTLLNETVISQQIELISLRDCIGINYDIELMIIKALLDRASTQSEVIGFLSLIIMFYQNPHDFFVHDDSEKTLSVLQIPYSWIVNRSLVFRDSKYGLDAEGLKELKGSASITYFAIMFEYYEDQLHLNEMKLRRLFKNRNNKLVDHIYNISANPLEVTLKVFTQILYHVTESYHVAC